MGIDDLLKSLFSKPSYGQAVFLVILGGALLSLLGLADRAKDAATGPQIVFYRAIGMAVFFSVVFFATRKLSIKQEFANLTLRGGMAALFMALSGTFLVMAFQYTKVANAIFIISLTPFIAAVLAWMFIKESIYRQTLIAMVIALFGVAVIFGTSLNGEGLFGMGLAVIMAIFYAATIVTMRTIPQANVILLCALTGFLLLPLMIPFIDSYTMTTKDLVLCLSLGVIQVGLGTLCVMTGAKYVPSAQVSILALIEIVLSPIWVWLYANEIPAMTTLIGGAIVLTGVIYQAIGAPRNV